MRLLLLHLSDIHFKTAHDTALNRCEAIVDAVRNLDYEVDLAVLAVTGDIAFSGRPAEYEIASGFLHQITERLKVELAHGRNHSPVPVRLVIAPGNHDCDFSSPGGARDLVLAGLLKDLGQAADSSVVEVCTAPQRAFFAFIDQLAPGWQPLRDTGYDARLAYEYTLQHGNEQVQFVCINTPWMSQLHEDQGSLAFPADAIPARADRDGIRIALFHHPYNWIESNAARAFRKRLEANFDVILTGHEHDATRQTRHGENGERNEYIEGGLLQDSKHPKFSAFNAVIIDTTTLKEKFTRFSWDGSMYAPANAALNAPSSDWADLQVNRLRQRGRYEIKSTMLDRLDDPGVLLTHREHARLTLSDIFVFPDAREVVFASEGNARTVRGDSLTDLVAATPHLILLGEASQGKTSLAKMLYRRLHDAGYVPLLLDGSVRPPVGPRTSSHLEQLFTQQYDAASLEEFRQLNTERRVVIVDDYHKLPLKAEDRHAFLTSLADFASRVILIADTIVLSTRDLFYPNGLPRGPIPFAPYRILRFGHVNRDALVQKWMRLTADADPGCVAYARELATIHRTIDTLIGRNFVPAFPVYLLAVLQAFEAAMHVNTSASTHGYFYEILIRVSLAKGRDRTEFDIVTAYLAHLAYRLFTVRRRTFDHAAFEHNHADYVALYDLSLSTDQMLEDLLDHEVLTQLADEYRFKYPYFFYYFVASYMRDHIGDKDVRAAIQRLSRTVFIEENANILLFLAHLSKDPIIIKELLDAANAQYSDETIAALEDDVRFINSLQPVAFPVVFHEGDPAANRAQMLKALDDLEDDSADDSQNDAVTWEAEESSADATLDYLSQLTAALKTLQILGQVLKNFPGSIEGTSKVDIVRACYGLGLRTLGTWMNMVRENERAIMQDLIDALRRDQERVNPTELENSAAETLVGMAHLVSFAMVARIASAVGSPRLSKTYKRVLDDMNITSARLIHTAVALDHDGEFPQGQLRKLAQDLAKNPLALSVLRYLAVQHLQLFPMDYKTRMQTCTNLGISYPGLQAADPNQKILPGAA